MCVPCARAWSMWDNLRTKIRQSKTFEPLSGPAIHKKSKNNLESLKIALNRTFRLIPDMFNVEILACVRYVVRTRVRIPPGPQVV